MKFVNFHYRHQIADQVTSALITSDDNITVPFVFQESFDIADEYEQTVIKKEEVIEEKIIVASESNEKTHALFDMSLEFINQNLASENIQCENPATLATLVNQALSVLDNDATGIQLSTSLIQVIAEAQRLGILTKNGQPLTQEEFKDLIKEFESKFLTYYSNYKPKMVEQEKPEKNLEDLTKDVLDGVAQQPIRPIEKKSRHDDEKQQIGVESLNNIFITHQAILKEINKVGEEKAAQEKFENKKKVFQDDIHFMHEYKLITKEDIDARLIKKMMNNYKDVPLKTLIKTMKITKKFDGLNQKEVDAAFFEIPKLPIMKNLTIRVPA